MKFLYFSGCLLHLRHCLHVLILIVFLDLYRDVNYYFFPKTDSYLPQLSEVRGLDFTKMCPIRSEHINVDHMRHDQLFWEVILVNFRKNWNVNSQKPKPNCQKLIPFLELATKKCAEMIVFIQVTGGSILCRPVIIPILIYLYMIFPSMSCWQGMIGHPKKHM